MDGFKSLPKMQCFKEGGHAKAKEMCYGGKAMKKGGEVKHDDAKEDKKMIKKAFGMHDKQLHEDQKTDLSGLKKGGRAKKEVGSVKKFNKGGAVGVYGAKKKAGDLDSIEKAKDIKPKAAAAKSGAKEMPNKYKTGGLIKSKESGKKADAPNAATKRPAMKGSDVAKEKSKPAGTSKAKEVADRPKVADSKSGAKGGPNNYKTGGKVKKFDTGGSTGYLTPDQQRTLRAVKTGNYRSSDDDNMNYAQPAPSSSGVKLPSLGPANNFPSLEDYQKAGSPAPWNPKKKGGAIKKYADGRSVMGTPEQKRIAAARDLDNAHKLNLLANINKLQDPAQQAQLMSQQQAIGGNNALNQLAGQYSSPQTPAAPTAQPTNMGTMGTQPSGINPNQD